MQQQLQRGVQILVLMAAGLMVGTRTDGAPPTKEDRDDVQKRLDSTEGSFKSKSAEIAKTQKILENLNKSIEALEKTVPALSESASDGDLKTAAEDMTKTLGRLKAIREKSQKDFDAGRTNSNKLQRELQEVLKEYFEKADPKMIAGRYGLPFDGVDFSGTADFVTRTTVPGPGVMHYGLGAEHTWNDSFWWSDSKGMFQVANLKAISQHEQVTTRDIYDIAQQLLSKKTPGILPPVGRAGLMVNSSHLKAYPEAYKGIFGNKSFPPSVLNNSTSAQSELQDSKVFRDQLDFYTRDEATRTFTVDGNSITYGIGQVGTPILCNAAGNARWNDRPNFTVVKNFYPNRLNVSSSAIPALENANRRDDKAKAEIEDYASGCEVDLVIQRPRWNADGTAIGTQYLNPKYREVIEDNLWKIVGKPKPKSPKDLDDVTVYPPELVKALYADVDAMAKAAVASEETDVKGMSYNLRGTSFASPTAAGVVLAARMEFPDASPAEIMDAMLSSCEPILLRRPEGEPVKDDVMYLTDSKTGWRFAPKGAGFGEFVVRQDATEKNPDSWIRMEQRLKAMREERMRITRNGRAQTKVTVGEGVDKREAVINGQPVQMTIDLPKLREEKTDPLSKNAKRSETLVMEAFEKVQMYNDLSFMMDESNGIVNLIKQHKFNEALAKLKTEVVDSKYVSETDPYYEDAVKAVKEAENNRSHTYSVNVPPNHDMTMTFASLRLKFKDKDKTDRFIVLESPDGRMIPITMSEPHDGYEVGSTSGFMRQSAVGVKNKTGTWKIHTHQELDTGNSNLVLAGTERNVDAGIIDVRETVLNKIEAEEAKARTALPAKNMFALTDPHQTLRDLHNPPAETKEKKGKSLALPASYEEQRDYLQALLDGSQLRKGNFIPQGKLWREGLGERPDRKKDKGPVMDKPTIDAIQQLFRLFSMTMPAADPLQEGIGNRWGEMALATERGELPLLDNLSVSDGKNRLPAHEPEVSGARAERGFHKDQHNTDLPYWQRKHLQDQARAAREPSNKYKMA